MYTVRQHRREVALTGVAALALVVLFAAGLLLPWVVMNRWPWLAMLLAVIAAGAWVRWGLWATGGPVAVLARTVILMSSAAAVIVGCLRVLGW